MALWRCGLGGFSAGFDGWVGCFARLPRVGFGFGFGLVVVVVVVVVVFGFVVIAVVLWVAVRWVWHLVGFLVLGMCGFGGWFCDRFWIW